MSLFGVASVVWAHVAWCFSVNVPDEEEDEAHRSSVRELPCKRCGNGAASDDTVREVNLVKLIGGDGPSDEAT